MPEAKVVAYDLGCKEIDELKAAGFAVVSTTTLKEFLGALRDEPQVLAMVVDCALALPALVGIYVTDMALFANSPFPNFFVMMSRGIREESWKDHQLLGVFYATSMGEVIDTMGSQLSESAESEC